MNTKLWIVAGSGGASSNYIYNLCWGFPEGPLEEPEGVPGLFFLNLAFKTANAHSCGTAAVCGCGSVLHECE